MSVFRKTGWLGLITAMGSTALGCSSAAVDGEIGTVAAALDADCEELGSSILTATCTASQQGYTTKAASSYFRWVEQVIPGATWPESKTIGSGGYYKILFNAYPSGSNPYKGSLDLVISTSGDYAIFVPSTATVSVQDKFSVNVSPVLFGATSCAQLPSYSVYPLNHNLDPYKIALTSTPSSSNIIVQKLSNFAASWYQDLDGDLYGNPASLRSTACTPPYGHSTQQGGDCSDGNPAINPGATDLPGDSIDSDCDGLDY